MLKHKWIFSFVVVLVCACAVFAVEDHTGWVTLLQSDSTSSGIYSFMMKSGQTTYNWSDGTYPVAGKKYFVPAGLDLLTVSSGKSNAEFKGDALDVAGRVVMRSAGEDNKLSLGENGTLLSGGSLRFINSKLRLDSDTITIEAMAEEPATIQLFPELKATDSRGLLKVQAYFKGGEGTGLCFSRRNQDVLPLPDSTFAIQPHAFTNFFGTIFVEKNVEFAFNASSTVERVVPGTLCLREGGFLTAAADGNPLRIGTLAAAGGVLRLGVTDEGVTTAPVITNALTFMDGAKLHVEFENWHPKAGAQKFPILKLEGVAAASVVTAEDFILDVTTAMWNELPKTETARVIIDELATGEKILSVEWPDEPAAPYYMENGAFKFTGESGWNVFPNAIADGDAALSVVKEGAGTWQFGTNLQFSGALTVNAGKVVVGQNWNYYRWVITDTYRGAEGDSNSKYRVVGIRSFGLFDAAGTDRVYGLSVSSEIVQRFDGYLGTDAYRYVTDSDGLKRLDMTEGTFLITKYDGSLKTYTGIDACTNFFMHSSAAAETFWSRLPQYHPMTTDVSTWTVITMRPQAGNLITSWDYVNDYYSTYNYQMISNCTLEASVTGAEWTEIGRVANGATKPTRNTWQGSKETYEPGFETHTGGLPISLRYPAEPISFNASSISVAAGATLEAHAGTAPVISDLVVDVSKGLGTIDGFAFAMTGTLRLVNAAGRRTITLPADLSKSAGVANLAAWTLLIDGIDCTRKVDLAVDETGLKLTGKGHVVILK